ncbi:hypothetical protein E3983_00175 [Legionella israelensis]|uniref:Uncharacterized protein n=1 Tax=Legionella israelensis TaxID=454 RepID=A0AAX1ECX4_9GAMM|nr:hypothetical protein [Legionella israelensis]QBR82912.1 hypothetical protein E3983_00175 [Legionella israelensis]
MMKKFFRSVIFLFILNGYAVAGSAVLSNQCSNVKNSLEPFVLVLQEGESIQSALTQCSRDANIISGAVMGIGGLKNPNA